MAAGTLTIRVLGDTKDAEKKLSGLQKTAGGMQSAGKKLSLGITVPVLAAGVGLFKLAEEAEAAQAKLSSSFESMGASAFTSMEELNAHAEALQSATTFDDEGIANFQSILLTFGNVTGDVFTQATELGLDMSAKLGTDLQSSATLVGKALNDPVKGISALTRVGVSFTQQQKDQIKAMVEGGDVAGAQAVIMGELEKQFGGTAEAMAQTNTGQAKQAMNALANAGESLAMVVAPAIGKVANWVKTLAERFQKLNPGTQQFIVKAAMVAAALGPVLIIGGKLVSAYNTIAGVFVKAGAKAAASAATTATANATVAASTNATKVSVLKSIALQVGAWIKLGAKSLVHAAKVAAAWLISMGPIGLVIAAVVGLVVLIVKNWDKIKKAIGAAGEWIKRTVRAAWEWIKRTTSTVWAAITGFFSRTWDNIKRAVASVGKFFRDKWKAAIDFVKNIILNFTLPGLIAKHWDKIKDGVRAVAQFIRDKWNAIIDFFKGLPARVGRALGGLFDGITSAFRSAVNWIIEKWNNLSFSIGGGNFMGIDIPKVTISTPNIPYLHTGTPFFRPPNGAREGMAILERGEAVIPAGQSRTSQVIHVVVKLPNDRALIDEWVVPGLQRYKGRGGVIPST